jgi:aryl-alcohol dehydrogenase-like predicted oxidoreductase
MEHRAFGKTGLKVSVLGFGGSEIGYQDASQKVAGKILGAALDAGINVIDTAECYADSEALIGKTIGHRREEFHLFTKCGHVTAALDHLGFHEWDPRLLAKSIDQSLKNPPHRSCRPTATP